MRPYITIIRIRLSGRLGNDQTAPIMYSNKFLWAFFDSNGHNSTH